MCSHTTKRCSWHEFPSACAARPREGRHSSGVSCSLCWVWGRRYGKELLSGMVLLWDTSRVLGLHSTHVGWWAREMRNISTLPPEKCKTKRNLGHPTSPPFSVVFYSLIEDTTRIRGLFQSCLSFTTLHKRAKAEQEACASAQKEWQENRFLGGIWVSFLYRQGSRPQQVFLVPWVLI